MVELGSETWVCLISRAVLSDLGVTLTSPVMVLSLSYCVFLLGIDY